MLRGGDWKKSFNSEELPKQLCDATEIVNALERVGQWLGLLDLNWEVVRFYHFGSNLYTILWHVLYHTNLGCNRKSPTYFLVLNLPPRAASPSAGPGLSAASAPHGTALERQLDTHKLIPWKSMCKQLNQESPKRTPNTKHGISNVWWFSVSQRNVPDQIFNTWPGFTSYFLLLIEKSVLVLPSDIFSDGRNSSNNFQTKIWVAWTLQQQKAAGIRIAADNSPYPTMQLSCHSSPLSIPRAVWKASCQTRPNWFAFLWLRGTCSKNWN